MQTAITRRTDSGRLLNADQSINVRQALRAMTINAAYQLGIDSQTGSLEVGKWADLQVVTENPYEVDAERLNRLQTQKVYVAGRLEFDKAE